MNRQSFISALLGLSLAAAAVAGLAGCSEDTGARGLTNPVVHVDTPDERRETVQAWQDCWRSRPRTASDSHRRAELRFLQSLGSFLNRIKATSEFSTACGVWNECVRDHTQQYGAINR